MLTTGGTGPAPRDVTPEATLAVAHKVLPGFGEQMRQVSLKYVPDGDPVAAGRRDPRRRADPQPARPAEGDQGNARRHLPGRALLHRPRSAARTSRRTTTAGCPARCVLRRRTKPAQRRRITALGHRSSQRLGADAAGLLLPVEPREQLVTCAYSWRSSAGSAKNTSDSTAKNSAGLSAAYGSIAVRSPRSTRAPGSARTRQHRPLPGVRRDLRRQRRTAVGGAVAHVELVRELVDDEVHAGGVPVLARLDVGPGQDHRAALHRLAGDRSRCRYARRRPRPPIPSRARTRPDRR